MTMQANAAAVKAALTLTGRIAGTDSPVFVAGGTALQVTRHATGRSPNPKRSGVPGTAATAGVPAEGHAFGGGILPAEVVARLAKAKGTITVSTDDGGLRFVASGVHLGTTVPDADPDGPDLQRVAWSHTALTSHYAVKVEADYAHHGPEVARAAVEALQGVAEATARGDDARQVLTAVALHAEGTAAATDTYRLHVADLQVEIGPEARPDAEVLVPAYVLQAIPAGKVVGFRLGAVPDVTAAGAAAGKWGMSCRLGFGAGGNRVTVSLDAHGPNVEGPYPNWRAIVGRSEAAPAAGTYIVPDGLPATVKAVQAKGPTYVTWSEGDAKVTLQAMTNTNGSVNLQVPEGAASATVGTATTGSADVVLQAAYLAPAAGFVGAGATVTVASDLAPVRLDGGNGRRALVMPMRAGAR